jgi:GxxExxY protein
MTENEIAQQIVDAAYKVHRTLGPGLLESAYQAILIYELQKRGLKVEPEKKHQSSTKACNSARASGLT